MIVIILFLIGLCVGSFLNVVIDRPMQKRSVVFGRSACDFCHHHLTWYDLVPVLSFVFLKGRCRYCHKKLSLQYPAVELATAVSFVFIYLYLPHQSPQELLFIGINFGLIASGSALFIADAKYQLLPNWSLLFFAVFSLLLVLATDPGTIIFRLLIGICASLPFFFVSVFSKGKGMGFGDVKLAFVMGFLLRFPAIVIALYVAFLTGAMVAIILVLGRKVRFHGGTIAFGPFLLLGTGIALIWGDTLWRYVKIMIGF